MMCKSKVVVLRWKILSRGAGEKGSISACSLACWGVRVVLNRRDNVQITGCGADCKQGCRCRWEGVQVCSHAGASASWVRVPSSTRPRCKRRVPAQHGARVDPPRQSVTRRDSGSVGLLPSQTGRDASVPGVSSSALCFQQWQRSFLIRIALFSQSGTLFPYFQNKPKECQSSWLLTLQNSSKFTPFIFLSFNCPALL